MGGPRTASPKQTHAQTKPQKAIPLQIALRRVDILSGALYLSLAYGGLYKSSQSKMVGIKSCSRHPKSHSDPFLWWQGTHTFLPVEAGRSTNGGKRARNALNHQGKPRARWGTSSNGSKWPKPNHQQIQGTPWRIKGRLIDSYFRYFHVCWAIWRHSVPFFYNFEPGLGARRNLHNSPPSQEWPCLAATCQSLLKMAVEDCWCHKRHNWLQEVLREFQGLWVSGRPHVTNVVAYSAPEQPRRQSERFFKYILQSFISAETPGTGEERLH